MLPPNWYNASLMDFRYRLALTGGLFLLLSACGVSVSSPTQLATSTLIPFQTATLPLASSSVEADLNPLTTPEPSPTPLVHRIQGGDTLLGISLRYGVSLENLLLANPGIDPRFLSVDQEVIIPGPEGEPVGILLPSPTPINVGIEAPRCFRSAPGGVLCIANVVNNLDVAVEGVFAKFALYRNGEWVGDYTSYGPLNLISPGDSLPIAIRIPEWEGEVPNAELMVLSGVAVPDPSSRYTDVSLSEVRTTTSPDGSYAVISGVVEVPEISEDEAIRIRLLGVVYDEDGFPIGLALIEKDGQASEFNSSFEMTVFGASDQIDSSALFVEGIRQSRD